MAIIRQKNAHLWNRDPFDWYVEPYECSMALFEIEEFDGGIWDPACGIGRIIETARASGYAAFGSDIVRRGEFCDEVFDFFSNIPNFEFSNIVSNPPFGVAEEFVQRCLEIIPTGGKVAMLLPMVWLSGFSSKRDWLPNSPLCRFLPISPRPSMPPGRVIEAGERPGNGTKDFAWFVWQAGYHGNPEVVFMNTKSYAKNLKGRQLLLV